MLALDFAEEDKGCGLLRFDGAFYIFGATRGSSNAAIIFFLTKGYIILKVVYSLIESSMSLTFF